MADAHAKTQFQAQAQDDKQETLRQNVSATSEGSASAKFVSDLEKTYDAVTKIDEETAPALETQRQEITQQLSEALQAISVKWNAITS